MLRTRLWMGAILVLLTVGMLGFDQYLPFYPFLFVFVIGLSVAACREMVQLLGDDRVAQTPVCYAGVLTLGMSNWLIHFANFPADRWLFLLAILAGLALTVFL